MNKYDLVLGIEIHTQTLTNSKMFSVSPSGFDKEVNTNVSPFDLGYPGTKPTINKEAVSHAIKLATILNMKINQNSDFDRKHYFYPDLPKGFQITQFNNPIGKDGILELSNGTKVKITQIHMEEDTAKQTHKEGVSFLDYNRAGMPLIEIVTDHTTLKTIEDATLFVKTLRSLLVYYNISNAKMNEGSMRCDINISLKPKGSKVLGNKVEIKNINSISNIELAIKKEIIYQTETLDKGAIVKQATKRFDDKSNDVISMREKSSSIDYLYFRETNIPTLVITNENIKNITKDLENFPTVIQNLAKDLKINEFKVLEFLNKESFPLFKKILEAKQNNILIAYNLFESVIASEINKSDKPSGSIELKELILLIKNRENKTLSQSQVGEIFSKMLETNSTNVSKLIKAISSSKMDDSEIDILLNELFSNNQELVSQYSNNPDKVKRSLMGQLMKATKGNVNPAKCMELINIKLNTLKN